MAINHLFSAETLLLLIVSISLPAAKLTDAFTLSTSWKNLPVPVLQQTTKLYSVFRSRRHKGKRSEESQNNLVGVKNHLANNHSSTVLLSSSKTVEKQDLALTDIAAIEEQMLKESRLCWSSDTSLALLSHYFPPSAPLGRASSETQLLSAKGDRKIKETGKMSLNKSYLPNTTAAAAKIAAKHLALEGVLRLDGVLSESQVNNLAQHVTAQLSRSLTEVQDQQVPASHRFSNMLAYGNRWDLMLPITTEDSVPIEKGNEIDADSDTQTGIVVAEALRTLLHRDAPLGALLREAVTEDAELFECAAFYTNPGARQQVLHADTLWTKHPTLYTATVALQPITVDMGPTVFLPHSHNRTIHRLLEGSHEEKSKLLATHPHCLSLLNTGDVAIYDSRVLHCGGANRSNHRRLLFYMTFRRPNSKTKGETSRQSDIWNVASLRPEYLRKYRLGDFSSN